MADLRIPFALPDLRPGAEFLLGAMNQKAARDTADRQAATQEEYARLGYAKLSATAERERQKHEQEGQDRLIKATAAAEALEDTGDLHGADRLRRLHGIQTKPIVGAPTQFPPTVITPAQALGGKPPEPHAGQASPSTSYRGPSVSPDNRGSMTPVQALAPQGPPPVAPEDSVENQMPITIPGDVEQGQIMPGAQLVGPRGEDLGINDPSARLAARQARAERIRGALQPVSPELAAIAGLDAVEEMGKDFSPVVRAYTAGRAEQGREGRSARSEGGRNTRLEDQQSFIAGENERYKDTPADRDRRAAMFARAKAAASGNQPNSALGILAEMAANNATDKDMQDYAAAHEIGPKDYRATVDPAARRAEGHAKLLVKDAITGKQYEAINQQAANDVGKMGPNIKQLVERTQKYVDHVNKFGDRVVPGTDEDIMRRSLAKSAAVAGRTFHQLGVALGWLRAEEDILGPSGSSESIMNFLLGARPEVIKNQLEEALIKYQSAVDARTRPMSSSGAGYRQKAKPATITTPDGVVHKLQSDGTYD